MGGAISQTATITTNSDELKIRGLRGLQLKENSGLVQERFTHALLKKRNEMDGLPVPMSLSKILLKVDKLRTVQKHIVDVFKMIAHEQEGLNLEALQECMNQLHGQLTATEVLELFNFVDIDQSKSIDLKEFWVVLTVGSVLEAIPSLVTPRDPPLSVDNPMVKDSATATIVSTEPPKSLGDSLESVSATTVSTEEPKLLASRSWRESQSIRNFTDMSGRIRDLLHLIVMAYLLFDNEGHGFISKDAAMRVLEIHGPTCSHCTDALAILEARFKEMDWDSNGTVDFGEFVFSFTSWFDSQDADSDV